MEKFKTIYARALKRKGGKAQLEKLLPERVSKKKLAAIPDDRWLSIITKGVFRAGFNWKIIDNKWPAFEAAFHNFDPGACALLSDDDLDALCQNAAIVRNAAKIASVRHNAAFICELAKEHGSAGAFFANWPAQDFAGLLDVLKTRASRLSGTTGQYFLRFQGVDSFVLSKDVVAALIRAGVVDKAPTSKKGLRATQDAFNVWAKESGLALSHISRILAMSIDA